jgi:Class II flagellar assembly regulator
MRVDPKSLLSPAGTSALQRRGSAGQRFTVPEEGTGRAQAASTAAPLARLDAVLALQGEADANERRRRLVRRGGDLLDALDRLKAALLSGRVPAGELRAIAARLAERRELSGDPNLDELIAHIDLRAQVELAKLGAA